ncbi:MAG: c-type cytochrome [Acidiferrobacterales bacterium]
MKFFAILIVTSVGAFGWLLSQAAEATLNAGRQQFTACQACHGQNGEGNKAANAPRLAGQHGWYLVRQLQNFRAGIRGVHDDDTYGQLMVSMAKGLPDERAVQSVAAYIVTLNANTATTTPAAATEKGKVIFSACRSCHGEHGEGNAALGGPRLAGQHDWYLIRQLQNFRGGLRGTHEQDTYGQTMASMAHALLPDEQAIKEVVAHIATLP